MIKQKRFEEIILQSQRDGEIMASDIAGEIEQSISSGELREELKKLGYHKISISKLQKVRKIGLNKALRIIDEIEEE